MNRRVQSDRYGPADVLQIADVPRRAIAIYSARPAPADKTRADRSA